MLRKEVIELLTASFNRILMRLLPIRGFGFSMVDSMLNSHVLVYVRCATVSRKIGQLRTTVDACDAKLQWIQLYQFLILILLENLAVLLLVHEHFFPVSL